MFYMIYLTIVHFFSVLLFSIRLEKLTKNWKLLKILQNGKILLHNCSRSILKRIPNAASQAIYTRANERCRKRNNGKKTKRRARENILPALGVRVKGNEGEKYF